MRIGPRQAEGLVTAYLGRAPQDELEAAVVLESWGGVRGEYALETARGMAFPPAPASTSARHRYAVEHSSSDEDDGSVSQVLASMAIVLALFLLAGVLAQLGVDHVDDAWRPAMPLTVGGTALLRRRYGPGSRAAGLLRRDRKPLAVLGALVVAGLALPGAAAVIAAFTVLALGTAITALRGWGWPVAAAIVAVAAVAAQVDADGGLTMGLAVGLVALTAVVAVVSAPRSAGRCRPWRRAIPAGLAGAATGCFLVAASSTGSGATVWIVGLAMAPALAATTVGGVRMALFWDVLPDALSATVVGRPDPRPRRVARHLILVAFGATALVVVVLSLAVVVAGDVADLSIPMWSLVGFGVAAPVTLAASTLEAMARSGWAVAVGLAPSVTYGAMAEVAHTPVPTAIALAGLVALVLAVPPLLALTRRPDLTMATLTP